MGKKDNKKDKKSAQLSESLTLNKTTGFAVLDVPGVTQVVADTTAVNGSSAHGGDKASGAQGRRATAAAGPKISQASGQSIGGDSFTCRTKDPPFLKTRVGLYEQIKARRQAELAKKVPVPIKVIMPDGTVMEKDKEGNPYMSWKTTPNDVAVTISQGLADSVTVARVTYDSFVSDYDLIEDGMGGADGVMESLADDVVEEKEDTPKNTFLWDLTRPLVGNVAKLELLKFENDQEARTVFWHSSAHMLGEALEHLYGCKLTIGPPLAGGFFYDSYMGKSDALREDDCKFICCIGHYNCTHLSNNLRQKCSVQFGIII